MCVLNNNTYRHMISFFQNRECSFNNNFRFVFYLADQHLQDPGIHVDTIVTIAIIFLSRFKMVIYNIFLQFSFSPN